MPLAAIKSWNLRCTGLPVNFAAFAYKTQFALTTLACRGRTAAAALCLPEVLPARSFKVGTFQMKAIPMG